MDYKKIPIILKRYSFPDKMNVLHGYSKQIMSINGVEIKTDQPLAWELETFLLFAIKSDEYQNKNFIGKNINTFINVINCIKNYMHPVLSDKEGTLEFANYLFVAMGSVQFDIQCYYIYKYYRYNYFFNYISSEVNMKQEFHNKFGINYNMFLEFGIILNTFISLEEKLNSKSINYILFKYYKIYDSLTISRDKFKTEIDKYSNNIDDYLYCVRPCNIYPFVKYEEKTYLPLPHCIIRSTTDSLLYRLTDNNSNLRDKFGKNVLEDYLYEIVNKSNLFEECLKEKKYNKGKQELKTPDLMCRTNDNCLFFECKSSVPSSKTRCMLNEFIQKELKRVSDNIIQLYKQLYFYFQKYYNFFEKNDHVKFNLDNCYGIVVLLEESYIRREVIYNEVAQKLKIKKSDAQYNWIINHIKVCNLYDIERFVFTNTDIIKSLNKQEKDNRPFDYSLSNQNNKSTLKNNDVYAFKKNIGNIIKNIADELVKVGYMSKK